MFYTVFMINIRVSDRGQGGLHLPMGFLMFHQHMVEQGK